MQLSLHCQTLQLLLTSIDCSHLRPRLVTSTDYSCSARSCRTKNRDSLFISNLRMLCNIMRSCCICHNSSCWKGVSLRSWKVSLAVIILKTICLMLKKNDVSFESMNCWVQRGNGRTHPRDSYTIYFLVNISDGRSCTVGNVEQWNEKFEISNLPLGNNCSNISNHADAKAYAAAYRCQMYSKTLTL